MSLLLLAEHTNSALHHATRNAVTTAMQLGGEIHILVAGHQCEQAAKQAAALQGVAKVLIADAPYYAWPLAEQIAPLVAAMAKDYTHILATATTTAKDIMPRIAALLGSAQASDIIGIQSPDTFIRPIYAGNALETITLTDKIKLITARQTAFAAAPDGGNAAIEAIAPGPVATTAQFVEAQTAQSGRPDLSAARIVISGGRGLGSAENFKKLEILADKLGAAIGASRAAVDAGFVSNDYQVGQTGKVVAPDLYIAIGISGAIQHLAGMKDSKVIVAINKDENAPIFELADYGLVADWQTALPELEALLGK